MTYLALSVFFFFLESIHSNRACSDDSRTADCNITLVLEYLVGLQRHERPNNTQKVQQQDLLAKRFWDASST